MSKFKLDCIQSQSRQTGERSPRYEVYKRRWFLMFPYWEWKARFNTGQGALDAIKLLGGYPVYFKS